MTWRALLVALGLVCCDDAPATAPAIIVEDLPPGVVARVGDQLIAASSVAHVASAQRISAAEARERLVKDALFAAHGRALLDAQGGMAQVERAALARALIEELDRQSRAAGEPSDAEIARLTEQRWAELDRPPAARTTHAVVLVKAETERDRARALSEKIAAAVREAKDAKVFRERASAVPKGALEVRVEALPPVTSDGRVIAPRKPTPSGAPERFDLTFSAAANALSEVGQQSPVVESAYGFHVILLEEKLPAVRLPLERRRQLLRDEALAGRARAAKDRLELELARATKIEIDPAARVLTAEVRIQP
jgi:peptidyl-prolyl cis-trans isomerase C